jgi:hypothetical protein
MKKRILEFFLGLMLLASLVIPAGGCTGYLDFAGYVYEWTNAPPGSTSRIVETEEIPEGYQVKPLAGVTVDANDEDQSHPFTMVSNAEGKFHQGLTVELQEDVIVKVNHPGYSRATLQFDVHKERYFYSLIVLLVPE